MTNQESRNENECRLPKTNSSRMKLIHKLILPLVAAAGLTMATPAQAYWHHRHFFHGHIVYGYGYPYYASYYGPYFGPYYGGYYGGPYYGGGFAFGGHGYYHGGGRGGGFRGGHGGHR